MNERVRILVVDDEPSIIELLGEYLRARGHEVHVAAGGEDALEILDAHPVDVVLTDMKMPGLGGLDLLERLEERGQTAATILMTGFGTIDSAIQAMKTGAHDYLLKPFKLREVHAAIIRAVERVRLERETVRLREVLGLYRAIYELSDPSGLDGIYRALCAAAQRELSARAALLAFDEPEAGTWVEYHRTVAAPFCRLDLEGLASAVVDGASIEDPRPFWFGEPVAPLLAAPIRAQVVVDAPPRAVGVVVVTGAESRSPGASATLQVYANIAGDAMSRQILSARLLQERGTPIPRFTGAISTDSDCHAERVAALVERAGEAAALSDDELRAAGWGARVHDYSRLGLGLRQLVEGTDLDSISLGGRGLPIRMLTVLQPVLVAMNERFDGYGTPAGLRGEEIPPIARLLAVADRWDMLTETRAFAPVLPPHQAAEVLRREAGAALDPKAVEALLSVTLPPGGD